MMSKIYGPIKRSKCILIINITIIENATALGKRRRNKKKNFEGHNFVIKVNCTGMHTLINLKNKPIKFIYKKVEDISPQCSGITLVSNPFLLANCF